MKRLLITLLTICVIIPASNSLSAQEQGDFRFGFRTGYYIRTKAFMVGAYGNYGLTDWLNIEPGVNVICKERSTVDIYCDLQVPLEVAPYWYFYPLVGISASDISEHNGSVDGWAAGLNVGIGTNYEFSGRWSVSAQAKWVGRIPRKHTSAVLITAGVGYNF